MTPRPPNPRKITMKDLRPGDVLLSAGTNALDQLILAIDEGDYTHSSLWDGTMVYEATTEGVVHEKIDKDMTQALVDAYRFVSDGHHLGDPGWPVDPIFTVAETFVGAPYAYDELVLAALAILTSEYPSEPIQREAVRLFGAEIAAKLSQWIESLEKENKKPMVCTEVVTTAFYKADTTPANRYGIHVLVDGTRTPPAPPKATAAAGVSETQASYEELRRNCQKLLEATRPEVWAPNPARTNAERTAALASPPSNDGIDVVVGGPLLPSGFASTRDLETSPTLQLVGCLKDDRPKK